MPVKPKLISKYGSRTGSATRSIASDRKLTSYDITVKRNAERSKSDSEVIANIVKVLQSIY